MRIKAAFIFFLTALLCGITVASVSYVGVYVSYVGLPILLVSGYYMVFGRGEAQTRSKSPSLIVESMTAVTGVLNDFNQAMDGVNQDLSRFNRANELKQQRTEYERTLERQLRTQRVKSEVHLRYATTQDEKTKANQALATIDAQLATVRKTIAAIDKQCELDAIEEQDRRDVKA
jgi:hypothetical protein